MTDHQTEIIIPKEDAVFWMDQNGCWWNADGKFRHKKVIDYFHQSIEKDRDGYFVRQAKGDVVEKVYFPYEETALFVFDVIPNEDIVLVLNTGRRIKLEPDKLFVKGEGLFVQDGDEIIKFTDRSMMKISRFIDEKDGRLFFSRNGKQYLIEEK